MKIKLTKEQFTHSLVHDKIRLYNEQIEKFNQVRRSESRAYLSEIRAGTARMFESSPLFHISNPDGKLYFYRRDTMRSLVDVVNALYNGIISEFELTDGADIRAYLELFGEDNETD